MSPPLPTATTSHHCRHHHPPPSLVRYDDNSRHQPRGGNATSPPQRLSARLTMERAGNNVARCHVVQMVTMCHRHCPLCEVSYYMTLPHLSFRPNAGATSLWVTWQPSHQHATIARMTANTTTTSTSTTTSTAPPPTAHTQQRPLTTTEHPPRTHIDHQQQRGPPTAPLINDEGPPPPASDEDRPKKRPSPLSMNHDARGRTSSQTITTTHERRSARINGHGRQRAQVSELPLPPPFHTTPLPPPSLLIHPSPLHHSSPIPPPSITCYPSLPPQSPPLSSHHSLSSPSLPHPIIMLHHSLPCPPSLQYSM